MLGPSLRVEPSAGAGTSSSKSWSYQWLSACVPAKCPGHRLSLGTLGASQNRTEWRRLREVPEPRSGEVL